MDTRNASTKVAVQYSQRLEHTIDSNAGAKERARFMDATEIKTKKKYLFNYTTNYYFPKTIQFFCIYNYQIYRYQKS
jgi:hypothetical protein